MTGKELKEVIKGLNLKQKEIALAIGVSEQAFTSYFRTTDVRQETLDKIDKAIRQLTDGQHGLTKEQKTNEPIKHKENIIDTLAGVVKDVERELADIRIIRAELVQQRERIEQRESEREQLFHDRMKQIADLADRLNLFGGVGNIPFADLNIAADENPRPK